MQAGKILRLERGLAEIEFDQGARVILQGPAGLELISASAGLLHYGMLTARVPPQARGFTILSPGGKFVDLGTEFGLSVNDGGTTTLRVFKGEVEAFPLVSTPVGDHGVTVHQDQTAQIDGCTVALGSTRAGGDDLKYVRAIVPPPVRTPRILYLDFTRPAPGTILDRDGHGIGLSARLPGTGTGLPVRDPNLWLCPERRALELTTTRSDLNTQERLWTGEYLGVRLADLGFHGQRRLRDQRDDSRYPWPERSRPVRTLRRFLQPYQYPRRTDQSRTGRASRRLPIFFAYFSSRTSTVSTCSTFAKSA